MILDYFLTMMQMCVTFVCVLKNSVSLGGRDGCANRANRANRVLPVQKNISWMQASR